jgi:aminoglycoside phosphotransferase (APT) family kinase protein
VITSAEIRPLTSWLAGQLPRAQEVRLEGLDRVELGHSSETLQFTMGWRDGDVDRRQRVVLRMRPHPPGLLEPYDLRRQFNVLRALEPTPVRAPRALWFEGSGAVLGREFYVMERVSGDVFEARVPDAIAADPPRLRRMGKSMIDQIAAIHSVNLHETGLDAIGDGRSYLDRELEHWAAEIRRAQRGSLPALDRLVAGLRDRQPEPCPIVTLVHGDPKSGNFAFTGDEVSAVLDWELATVGDPLADVGWAELQWGMPGSFTSLPGCLSADEFVARYETLTGTTVRHRAWYRAFQGLKMAAILLVGGMLFDRGITDDLRFADYTLAIHPLTLRSLHELGIADDPEPGLVTPRPERVRKVRKRVSRER